MLCYSTDPIKMAEIKKKKPKYRPTDKQKLDWATEDCRRFGSAYQMNRETQKIDNQFTKNHHEE